MTTTKGFDEFERRRGHLLDGQYRLVDSRTLPAVLVACCLLLPGCLGVGPVDAATCSDGGVVTSLTVSVESGASVARSQSVRGVPTTPE
ncbi:hypothetical protein [Halomarina oriensis]|uniref:Uncharacterized protein n=1 Tax=Halomarina oriensis TaxID=671145 RepID=A0A6B0GQS0_9EURY|nr:hypothetical protein [Halomarina oriensis]MWG35717.1 hypothetical protein [Halomarina oriensis]